MYRARGAVVDVVVGVAVQPRGAFRYANLLYPFGAAHARRGVRHDAVTVHTGACADTIFEDRPDYVPYTLYTVVVKTPISS